jgi:hypothetical protein
MSFVGSAIEKEKMKYKFLELGMVAQPSGLDLTTSDSAVCQNFLQMSAFCFWYELAI